MSSYRGRNWSLISYIDNDDVLLDIIRNCKNIRDYAFIYHNKDILENGDIKTPHYHIALILRDARTRQQIEKLFISEDKEGKRINCLAEKTIDNKSIIDYFVHKNYPDKYQYDSSLIVSSDIKAFVDKPTTDDNTFSIIDDMLNGVKLRDMVFRYGRDFLYHYPQIKTLVSDILFEENAYKRTYILSEVSNREYPFDYEFHQENFFEKD